LDIAFVCRRERQRRRQPRSPGPCPPLSRPQAVPLQGFAHSTLFSCGYSCVSHGSSRPRAERAIEELATDLVPLGERHKHHHEGSRDGPDERRPQGEAANPDEYRHGEPRWPLTSAAPNGRGLCCQCLCNPMPPPLTPGRLLDRCSSPRCHSLRCPQ
jgi:hypothetical protein